MAGGQVHGGPHDAPLGISGDAPVHREPGDQRQATPALPVQRRGKRARYAGAALVQDAEPDLVAVDLDGDGEAAAEPAAFGVADSVGGQFTDDQFGVVDSGPSVIFPDFRRGRDVPRF